MLIHQTIKLKQVIINPLEVPETYPASKFLTLQILALIARCVGPTWGPSGADRTQVGPMLAPWTLHLGDLTVTATLILKETWYQTVWVILCNQYYLESLIGKETLSLILRVVNTAPADGLAPSGARPSAGTVMTKITSCIHTNGHWKGYSVQSPHHMSTAIYIKILNM